MFFERFRKSGRNKGLLAFIIMVLVASSAMVGFGLASKGPVVEMKTEKAEASSPVDKVCDLIYKGKFDKAKTLIKEYSGYPDARLKQLQSLIKEHEELQKKREKKENKLYREKVSELNELKAEVDANGFSDVNDVNEITDILSVVAEAKRYADKDQKKELLSKPFVKKVVEKSIDKAAEFEEKGQWLDAYIVSYSWLSDIFEDNEMYSDYADDLLDKANMVASFKDSACETSRERYSGINKDMFYRTLDVLNYNYVGPIDYKEMAKEGIRRCDLLSEVMTKSFSEISESKVAEELRKEGNSFAAPESNEIALWRSKIDQLKAEIDNSGMGMTKDELRGTLEKVLDYNKQTANLPKPLLVAQFTEGALSALDPYTVMIWPKQVENFEKALTNQFTGIGIHIGREKGKLKVISLLPDTPAYHSGLDAGDLIEKVDGEDAEDMTTTCAVKKITGPKGSDVTLTIRRPGDSNSEDKVMDITITRDEITVPTIRGWQRTEKGKILYMLDPDNKIGYIKLTNFDEQTGNNFEEALEELEKQGMKGLILDLRNNPGGLLNVAHEIADKFIEKGLIVSTRPRFGIPNYLSATKSGTHPDYPLVVLINSGSASASEIVAGALGDKKYDRAILIGDRTHGKGSVQTIVGHPGGGAQLKYTMAYYHLPSGQKVKSRDAMKKKGRKDWGVGPDVKVKLNPKELERMDEVQWDNYILVKEDHDSEAKPVQKYDAQETVESDPQLATALTVLKAKLIEKNSMLAAK